MWSGMKELSLEGKLKITFEDPPPGGAVPPEPLPPPGPDVREEVLDAIRDLLGRHQHDNAVRLQAGLEQLGRRLDADFREVEGDLRNIHQRLDQQEDQAR